MSETQKLIVAMTKQEFEDWHNGTEPLLFPVDSHTSDNPCTMIWNMAVNAMAYGFDRALSVSLHDFEEKEEETQ